MASSMLIICNMKGNPLVFDSKSVLHGYLERFNEKWKLQIVVFLSINAEQETLKVHYITN